jgi:hypothetical protein
MADAATGNALREHELGELILSRLSPGAQRFLDIARASGTAPPHVERSSPQLRTSYARLGTPAAERAPERRARTATTAARLRRPGASDAPPARKQERRYDVWLSTCCAMMALLALDQEQQVSRATMVGFAVEMALLGRLVTPLFTRQYPGWFRSIADVLTLLVELFFSVLFSGVGFWVISLADTYLACGGEELTWCVCVFCAIFAVTFFYIPVLSGCISPPAAKAVVNVLASPPSLQRSSR